LPLALFSLYFAGAAGVAFARWIDGSFGSPSIDQVLYHLVYAEGAALDLGRIFILTFVVEVLALPLMIAAVAAWVHRQAEPQLRPPLTQLLSALPAVAVLTGVTALLLQFSAFSYAAAHFGTDEFARQFVAPQAVPLRPAGKPRNLVLVYAESLETSYGDARVFGRDLLAPLRGLPGTSFADYRGAVGTNWTMGGIVGTQCGVPLKVYSERPVKRRPGERSFLPGATCLGDVLRSRGYRNVFLGGAPLSFAGKGDFLADHGYQEAWGREQWEQAGAAKGDFNEWGLYDHVLLQRALRRLDELHAAGQPFNLTLLTLDTHNPHGFLSPECRRRGAQEFGGIVHCTSALLAEFAAAVRQRGYLEDTVLVIMGDHLAMPNPLHAQLLAVPERRIYNVMLGDGLPAANTREVLPFDFYPTLLEALGWEVAGDRLALGWSALGPAPPGRPAGRHLTLPPLPGSAEYRKLWSAEP
jgi:phosphoglycerol transferase